MVIKEDSYKTAIEHKSYGPKKGTMVQTLECRTSLAEMELVWWDGKLSELKFRVIPKFMSWGESGWAVKRNQEEKLPSPPKLKSTALQIYRSSESRLDRSIQAIERELDSVKTLSKKEYNTGTFLDDMVLTYGDEQVEVSFEVASEEKKITQIILSCKPSKQFFECLLRASRIRGNAVCCGRDFF